MNIKPIKAQNFLTGGKAHGKKRHIGSTVLFKYKIHDADSIPAVLSNGEYVLTKAMQKRVLKAFDSAHMKRLPGM